MTDSVSQMVELISTVTVKIKERKRLLNIQMKKQITCWHSLAPRGLWLCR